LIQNGEFSPILLEALSAQRFECLIEVAAATTGPVPMARKCSLLDAFFLVFAVSL